MDQRTSPLSSPKSKLVQDLKALGVGRAGRDAPRLGQGGRLGRRRTRRHPPRPAGGARPRRHADDVRRLGGRDLRDGLVARGEAAGLPGGVPAVRPGDLPGRHGLEHPDGVPADDARCLPQRQPRGVDGGDRGEGRLGSRRTIRSTTGSGGGRRWRSSARRAARSCSSARRSIPSRCCTTPSALADVPGKRTVRYRQPILGRRQATWVEVEEFDTSRGIRDWATATTSRPSSRSTWRRGTAGRAWWGRRGRSCSTPRSWSAFGVGLDGAGVRRDVEGGR